MANMAIAFILECLGFWPVLSTLSLCTHTLTKPKNIQWTQSMHILLWSWNKLHMQYFLSLSSLGWRRQIIIAISPVKHYSWVYSVEAEHLAAMLEIKCLICWNTVRITALRIRLNQLSSPNHYMLNRIGVRTQVRCLLTFTSTPGKNSGRKTVQQLELSLCSAAFECSTKEMVVTLGPSIYHLLFHCCAVSLARLRGVFGMDVPTLVTCY